MTIRRQWLFVLTITAILAVSINSVLLSSLINRYFLSYTAENYNNHAGQIQQLAVNALTGNEYTAKQLSVQFESHLDDPIISIKLYDTQGQLVASAENNADKPYGMMGGRMAGRMGEKAHEVDSYQIKAANVLLGQLNITRNSALNSSQDSSMFKAALVRNSLLSLGAVLAVLLLIGFYISRKLSGDLMNTATQALAIDLDNQSDFKLSKVKEIRIIQTSLHALSSRLKLKQLGRKKLVDELVHQTRTPLTILKTHLEGFEDGIITMSSDKIKICQEQIENITSIISNMSTLLDADKPMETTKNEEVDINHLLNQIISGLKAQFEKKELSLQLLTHQKVIALTDKYKLSQSIYNVLTNAYKFTESKGKVELSYTVLGGDLAISIKDSGIGISDEDKMHLFDAYYRGAGSARGSGDGLGLFVAKENVAQLGGTMTVESEIGRGSAFIITIPTSLGYDKAMVK